MYRIIDTNKYDFCETRESRKLRQLNSNPLTRLHYRADKPQQFIDTVRSTLEQCPTDWFYERGDNQLTIYPPGAYCEFDIPIGCVEGHDFILECSFFYEKIKAQSKNDLRFNRKSMWTYYFDLLLAGVLKSCRLFHHFPFGVLRLDERPHRAMYFCVDGDLLGLTMFDLDTKFGEQEYPE